MSKERNNDRKDEIKQYKIKKEIVKNKGNINADTERQK